LLLLWRFRNWLWLLEWDYLLFFFIFITITFITSIIVVAVVTVVSFFLFSVRFAASSLSNRLKIHVIFNAYTTFNIRSCISSWGCFDNWLRYFSLLCSHWSCFLLLLLLLLLLFGFFTLSSRHTIRRSCWIRSYWLRSYWLGSYRWWSCLSLWWLRLYRCCLGLDRLWFRSCWCWLNDLGRLCLGR